MTLCNIIGEPLFSCCTAITSLWFVIHIMYVPTNAGLWPIHNSDYSEKEGVACHTLFNQWNFTKLSGNLSLTSIYIILSEICVQFWHELRELLKGCVWAVTSGPPCTFRHTTELSVISSLPIAPDVALAVTKYLSLWDLFRAS